MNPICGAVIILAIIGGLFGLYALLGQADENKSPMVDHTEYREPTPEELAAWE
jgi:hypothetical protein